jgi:hypothetical protein
MLRRKKDHTGKPTEAASNYAGRPGQAESMRVLAAFLAQAAPGASAPGSAPVASGAGPATGTGSGGPGPEMGASGYGPATGAGGPAPPPPLAVTGWAGSSPPPPPALNIRPLIGAENSYANLPPAGPQTGVPIPGVGPVSSDRLEQVFTQVNALVTRLSGGADLSQRWTPAQVHTALAGLEVEHSQGNLTEEQYRSLMAALQSMLVE